MFLIRENQNITGITSSICFLWLQNISIFLISSYVKEDKDKSHWPFALTDVDELFGCGSSISGIGP